MSDCPIVLENLRKTYGSFVAVDGLSMNVERNSFTGLLGPNGAGKSTTLKMLTNLITPTSGHAYINGHDVQEEPKTALEGVGTVVETPEFYLYMTPRETYRYIGEIFGMSEESIASQTDDILAKVKMSEWADKKLGTFSKGMRQRISLGLALMNSPSVVILDEPTSGLDPRGMAEMREILKNIRNGKNNLTVLMSSHMMHEVTDLCDRIALVNHGRLVASNTLDAFVNGASERTILIRTVSEPSDAMVEKVAALPNVDSAVRYGDEISVKFGAGKTEQADFLEAVAGLGIGAYSLSESDNGLEERYLELVKESR